MRTISFGWIGVGVRQSCQWYDRCDEGLRWCDQMGFLGLTNGFGHCSTNELDLGFSGLSGVSFWVPISLLSLSLSAHLSLEIL